MIKMLVDYKNTYTIIFKWNLWTPSDDDARAYNDDTRPRYYDAT